MQVHLDTDLGTDPDDVCALAMLLGWQDVDVVGVTTSADPGGLRAGYVTHCLHLLGRDDVPVVAGAEGSLSHDGSAVAVPRAHYWPQDIVARPAPAGAAASLLQESVERGAVVVAIGPYTNLATWERERPGALARAHVVVMGGWVYAPRAGLPEWGPERDYNVQWDTDAARVVHEHAGELTMSTLPVSLQVPLRRSDLSELRRCGAIGALIAQQSVAEAQDSGKAALGRLYAGLPDDLLNFHYDPLAGAVAAGWGGASVQTVPLHARMRGGVLHWSEDARGRPVRVVVDADGVEFREVWLSAVGEAARRAG